MLQHEYKTYNNTFKLPVAILKTDHCEFSPHWHYDFEAACIVSGTVSITLNGITELLSAGDVCICANGDIHSYFSPSKDSVVMILMFNPIAVRKAGTLILASSISSGIFHPGDEKVNRYYNEIIDKMYEEYTHLNDTSIFFLYAYILELQGLLHRYYTKRIIFSTTKRHHYHLQCVRESMNFIEENCNNDISITEMAQKSCMSISNFSRVFKNVTGTTFAEYVALSRIRSVVSMMEKNEFSISQIALECGFNSIRTFNRNFKKIYRITPREYMKIHFDK